jgi:hypothetical protein
VNLTGARRGLRKESAARLDRFELAANGGEVGRANAELAATLEPGRGGRCGFEFDSRIVNDRLRLLLSPRLKAELPQRSVAENFGAYAGETLHFPDDAAPPELAFLSQHRATIVRKT